MARTVNLTNEEWPARTQTERGAQGSKDVRGIAAGVLVSLFVVHLGPSFTLEESGPRPGAELRGSLQPPALAPAGEARLRSTS
jgi:hypothetical protein